MLKLYLITESTGGGGPVFLVHVSLVIPMVAVRPTLDEVQEALTNAGKNITSVARGVGQWTGGRMQQVGVALSMLLSAFTPPSPENLPTDTFSVKQIIQYLIIY